MTLDKDPNNWGTAALVVSLLAAGFGRLSRLGDSERRGRRIWTWNLVFEIPTAVLMVWIGRGVGDYFAFSEVATNGLIGALAYMGPKGLLEGLERHLRREKK